MMEHPIATHCSRRPALAWQSSIRRSATWRAGIVKELTTQKRNCLVSYGGYIEIMSRGNELPNFNGFWGKKRRKILRSIFIDRQIDGKGRAFPWRTLNINFPMMTFDDPIADRQTQTSSLYFGLCRVERLKD